MVSYQTKNRLRRGIKIALLVLAALLLLAVVRFIYLERFLVFDKDSVHLDLGGGVATVAQQEQAPSAESFPLVREEAQSTEITQPVEGQLKKLTGASVSAPQLLDADVREDLSEYTENAILLEVKTATGKFLYPTQEAHTDVSAKAEEIGAFLKQLKGKRSVTRIARLPAFADRSFALSDFKHSLAIQGGALWMDENGSYWLDPAAKDVREYLIAEAKELSRLGFDEIVFDNFNYPQSNLIVYDGDGREACREAAHVIADALRGSGILCSFISDDPEILSCSARGYVPVTDEMLIAALVGEYTEQFPGDSARIVFLTDSRDSRLADYSMLSPWTEE